MSAFPGDYSDFKMKVYICVQFLDTKGQKILKDKPTYCFLVFFIGFVDNNKNRGHHQPHPLYYNRKSYQRNPIALECNQL